MNTAAFDFKEEKREMRTLIKAVVSLALILAAFAGTVQALEKPLLTLFLTTDGENLTQYETRKDTVGEFLAEQGIVLGEKDSLSPPADYNLRGMVTITLRRAVTLRLILDGNPVPVKAVSSAPTVADFIDEYAEETGKGFMCDENLLDTVPYEGMFLYLNSDYKKIETRTEVIPFETVYVENADVDAETIVNPGEDGLKTVVTEVHYSGGKIVDRKVISENEDVPQLKQLVYIPTKKVVSVSETETLKYSEKMTMSATAYTLAACCVPVSSKYYGLTASGMKAEVGVIAVDPNVIPLGTELYVEGYGYCVAGDTGGAVKGNIIDLYFDTLEECYAWGRRNVEVYVIVK